MKFRQPSNHIKPCVISWFIRKTKGTLAKMYTNSHVATLIKPRPHAFLAVGSKNISQKPKKSFIKSLHSGHKKGSHHRGSQTITDHVMNTKHVIGGTEASIKMREQDRFKGQIKESILIRKKGQKTMNRDGGNYHLLNIYDQLLMRTPPSTDESRRTDRKLDH